MNKSIKTQLNFMVLGTISLVLLGVTTIAYWNSPDLVKNSLKDDKVVGAVTGDILLEQFTKEIYEAKIGQYGYAFLISPGRIVVSHPNKELVMKKTLADFNNHALSQAMDEIRSGKSGNSTTTIDGQCFSKLQELQRMLPVRRSS